MFLNYLTFLAFSIIILFKNVLENHNSEGFKKFRQNRVITVNVQLFWDLTRSHFPGSLPGPKNVNDKVFFFNSFCEILELISNIFLVINRLLKHVKYNKDYLYIVQKLSIKTNHKGLALQIRGPWES